MGTRLIISLGQSLWEGPEGNPEGVEMKVGISPEYLGL